MPKYIIDPGLKIAELGWGQALLIALCGLIVVFMMLGILALVIMVISKVVNAIEGKKPAAAPAKKAAPAPAPKPAAAPAAPARAASMEALMAIRLVEEEMLRIALVRTLIWLTFWLFSMA